MSIARAAAASALLALATVGGAHATQISGLFDTGVDSTGTAQADGYVDTHYLVNGVAGPVVYSNIAYNTPADAAFIGALPNGQLAVNPNTYSLAFDLTGLDPTTASISGGFEADNYATVYLNGHQVGQDAQGLFYSDFQALSPIATTGSDFVSGVNTLTFVVTDGGAPSGLLVSALSGTASPLAAAAPEPASWALMLIGFGGVGGLLRRRTTATQSI